MNVVSYVNGDTHITDFPYCSARPLAAFVQVCNDLMAGSDDYLSPENSLLALDLAWQTVGTTNVADTVIHAWVAELLASRNWGVIRYTRKAAAKSIFRIAELHRMVAAGDMPPIAAWDAADRAARTIHRAGGPTLRVGGLYAMRAAYHSTALADTNHRAKLDAIAGNALHAHIIATGGTKAAPMVKLARDAIHSWRDLAGLDNGPDIDSAAVQSAARCIAIPV